MTPFGVLADDLTGSCDTGVQFSARGARVLVLAAPEAPLPAGAAWDVVVLNTESRHLPPEQAAAHVREGARRLADAGRPVRYKKVDSTLRGPLVAEAAPLLEAGGLLLCPAFPAAGRTVERGILRVNGRPVQETEFGRDRHNPVPESHLPTVLAALGEAVGQVTTRELFAGAEAVRARLDALGTDGVRVVAADATEDAHLAALAAALVPTWDAPAMTPLIAVGSAGLAAALAAHLLPQAAPPPLPPAFPRSGPVLVVAGSRSAVTAAQVQQLSTGRDVHTLALEPATLDAPDWHAAAWAAPHVEALAGKAAAGAETLLVTVAPDADGEDAARFARRSRRLNAGLGALAAGLAARQPLGGLVLTGGDIARAVLAALEAEALQLGPQVLPGIPLGWPVAGPHASLPVVTKAGGFGGPTALADAAHYLREGCR